MKSLTEQIVELQESVTKAKTEHDKAQGALDSIKKELKAKGYNTLKELSSDIAEREAKAKALEESLNISITEWKEKYGHLISE